MKATLEVNWFAPETKEGDNGEVVELEISDAFEEDLVKLSIMGNEILINKDELDRVLDLFRGKAF